MIRPTTRHIRDALVGLAIMLGAAACTWQGMRPDQATPDTVYIRGNTAHISDQRLAAIARPWLKRSFLDVDTAGLQQKLNAMAWLTDVRVSRHWPRGVLIRVREYRAVARWNSSRLLAADGTLFAPPAQDWPAGLVRLSGPAGSSERMYRVYQKLAQSLGQRRGQIEALVLTSNGGWRATLASGLRLRLGERDLAARMRRFARYGRATPKSRAALAKAAYVDLRYSNGFAVGGQRGATSTESKQEHS